MIETARRPQPEPDPGSEKFFREVENGELWIQRCPACETFQLGELICNQCFANDLDWIKASGYGVVHTFTIIHVDYHPAFPPPYNVAAVELDEGPRVLTNIFDVENSALKVGARVRATFRKEAGQTLLGFVPTAELAEPAS